MGYYQLRFNGLIGARKHTTLETAKQQARFYLLAGITDAVELWYTAPNGMCSWHDTLTDFAH